LKVSVSQGQTIDIIHAGREDDAYSGRLQALNWYRLFEQGLGQELERIRGEWKDEYDYILIDSRTGITDIGGICSILLPDYLLSLFTTTEQSVLGVREVMTRARTAQQDLPLDRQRLVIIPIAARDESNTEYERAAQWRKRFAQELSVFYDDWIHKDETAESVLDYLKIPYVAFWSFGEQLPVLEEDASNPKNLAYSYALIARLIHGRLNWAEVKEGREVAELQAKQAAEVQARLAEANKVRVEALAQQHAEAERILDQRKKLLSERFDQLVADLKRKQRLWDISIGLLAGVTGIVLAGCFGLYLRSPVEWGAAIGPMLAGIFFVAGTAAVGLILTRRDVVRSADELQREKAAYSIGHGRYVELGSEAGLRLFGDRIERIAAGRVDKAQDAPAPANAPAPSATTAPSPPGGAPGSMPGAQPGMPLPPPPSAGRETGGSVVTNEPGPATTLDLHAPIDVFLSSAPSGISRDWVIEFMPLFSRWLSEMLGLDAVIFYDRSAAAGDRFADAIGRAIRRARTAIVIPSRRYLQSEWTRQELGLLADQLPPDRIFPLRLEASQSDDIPPQLRSIQWTDFSDVAYVGEGFAKSERYIEFQDRIRALAKKVAAAIETAERQQSEVSPTA
jgi:cellulose biosynthesis protein BcsQ